MSEPKRDVADAELELGLIYSSPAIHERRRRILDETRKMIQERGLAGFSMDEIGKRAGVAKRTLYNAYQTKERMIAIAIHEYFQRYLSQIPFSGEVGTLQRNVERMIFMVQRDLQLRNYISAIMSLYFSPDAGPSIWNTMHKMTAEAHLQWILPLKAKRQLQPWVEPYALADDIVRTSYAALNDWCRGRIGDDEVVLHVVRTFLTIAAGATRGAARKEVEEMLLRFHTEGVPMPDLPVRVKRRS